MAKSLFIVAGVLLLASRCLAADEPSEGEASETQISPSLLPEGEGGAIPIEPPTAPVRDVDSDDATKDEEASVCSNAREGDSTDRSAACRNSRFESPERQWSEEDASPPPGEAAAVMEKLERARLAPNAVYFEGMGAGVLYSLNYERLLFDLVSLRAGVSYARLVLNASSDDSGEGQGEDEVRTTLVTIPLTLSYLAARKGPHGFEVGAGATVAYVHEQSATSTSSSEDGVTADLDLLVGYRLHPVEHLGFQLRAGLNLIMALRSPRSALPWPYLSIGVAF